LALFAFLTFTIATVSLEGIDFFTRSTNDVTIIWDRIQVLTTSATSTNPEIETSIQIHATLAYEYDNTEVIDGTVTLWDEGSQITMFYNASGGFWYTNVTKVDIGNYTFYISAVSGNQYGITILELDGNVITVEYIPAILPRLTPMMIATISGGFGIILIASGILVRKKYLIKVPYEIKQINQALKSMEKGEPVEQLDVRGLDKTIFAVLEPGLVELGLSEIIVDVIADEAEETWVADSEAELLDIMDEFKLPDYKQEIDEGELDISLLTETESEHAWTNMIKEVRRIESKEGRKVPLTKDDWIEKIPSEIKSIFFEEELRELDVPELEHLTDLTPDEVSEIMDSISQNEDMYSSLEPETSAAAISSALSDRIDAQEGMELDETAKKERLFQMLPSYFTEFFSTTWIEKLSCEEIEELLSIPETELKTLVRALKDSKEAEDETDAEIEEAEAEVKLKAEPEVGDEVKPKVPTQDDLKADLIAELKIELESEPEIDLAESVIEHDDPRMPEFVEKYGEEKANLLITISETMLEGIPEDQIKEMDMETLEDLKDALKPDFAAEPDVAPEDEPVVESEDEPQSEE